MAFAARPCSHTSGPATSTCDSTTTMGDRPDRSAAPGNQNQRRCPVRDLRGVADVDPAFLAERRAQPSHASVTFS
jgi:hypothetical protein